MKCRLCQSKTKQFLDLGKTALPEEFRPKSKLNQEVVKYSLTAVSCSNCYHVQLGLKVPVDIIYKKNYFYDYSITQTGKKHWSDMAKFLYGEFKLKKDDLVLDIGSNTGILLENFKSLGLNVLGVDPNLKLSKIAIQKKLPTIVDYFTPQIAKRVVKSMGQAKLITCNNTFDHVDDLENFMHGLTYLLRKDGIFIIEVPYFRDMLFNLNHVFYHHQIDYFLLKPLINFLKKFKMEIFDCQMIDLHGGSVRIFINFIGRKKIQKRLNQTISWENQIFKDWNKILSKFTEGLLTQKNDLINLVFQLKKQNKQIAALGASAKGITLLNYCQIGPETISCISDKSPLKIGKFTPSGIPIVDDADLLLKKPDFILMLAWNFKEEILENFKKYHEVKTKFIIPVPKLKIT